MSEPIADWIEKLGEELEKHPLSVNGKIMLMVLISEKVGNSPVAKGDEDRI